MSRYRFIEAEKVEGRSVNRACVVLEVSRAAYYEWRKQEPSEAIVSRDVIARGSALRWATGSGEVLVKSMVRSGLASPRTSCRSSGSSGRGRDGRCR